MNKFRLAGVLLILLAGLGVLFYLKPWEEEEEPPRLIDRLPEGNVIGSTDILELARRLMPTTYYYQLSYREFISPEFILGQGKGFGLDLQGPVYFFGDEKKEELSNWGVMCNVIDSSKIYEGVQRMDKFLEFKDSLVQDQRIFKSQEYGFSISYGSDWFLLCSSNHVDKYLNHILSAKSKGITSRWKELFADDTFEEQAIIAKVDHSYMPEYGLEEATFSIENDSSSVTLVAKLKQKDSLGFSLKEYGPCFEPQEFSKHLVNAHLNIDRLRNNPDDPAVKLLRKLGKKVSFPLQSFLNAWEGDVTFRQGGIQNIREKYITSEFDENFNVTEVVKYKNVKISGFSLYLSMNENRDEFLTTLYDKGIITNDDRKVRLLYSPPMNLKVRDTALVFHTGRYAPFTEYRQANDGVWTVDYVPVSFNLDSTSTYEVFGRVQLPLDRIMRKQTVFPK